MSERFATAQRPLPSERHLTFLVTPEVIDQLTDEWSVPVRFRFEKHEDGTTTMWLQNVEQHPTAETQQHQQQ